MVSCDSVYKSRGQSHSAIQYLYGHKYCINVSMVMGWWEEDRIPGIGKAMTMLTTDKQH